MKQLSRMTAGLVVTGMTFMGIMAAEWTDPAGDVTSPPADIVSGSATVANGMVDLRVRFVEGPSGNSITWLLDLDQNPATSHLLFVTNFPGADGFLHANMYAPQMEGMPELNLCANGSLDRTTHTLRILFPASLIPRSVFNYGVQSNFGGSNGAWEAAPNTIRFSFPGDYFTSDSDDPGPFQGESLCREVGLDIQPQNTKNTINMNSKKLIQVAVLSDTSFDAVAELAIGLGGGFYPTVGRTGGETQASCGASPPADVNGDGLLDMICVFNAQETGFQKGDTVGHLLARTQSGMRIHGSDAVSIQGGH